MYAKAIPRRKPSDFEQHVASAVACWSGWQVGRETKKADGEEVEETHWQSGKQTGNAPSAGFPCFIMHLMEVPIKD